MSHSTTIDLNELLKQYFGFSEFKSGQKQVIEKLLDGKSALAVFPTGGGKSLCYQLPALALDGLTIVVSPLIALMKDQIDSLRAKGIVAVRLDSSLSRDEYQSAMSSIRSGEAKLLYVAPERFFNERFRSSLQGVKVSLFAVDEAHCISQWGHNFRPDYLKLAMVIEQLKVERVLALTATATPEVQQDICQALHIEAGDVVSTPFYRSNLHIKTSVLEDTERVAHLIDQLKSRPAGATIVYVTLQKTAETVATALADAGLAARAYHAGMNAEQRTEIQEWFMQQPNKIVVATIAFGMGIDKQDIRAVYHFNLPKSIENYAQEIGRAGRDDEESHCQMLVVTSDRFALENFVYGDTPDKIAVEKFIRHIHSQADEFYLSQYKVGSLCDIKALVVKTMLTYLELDGFLESISPRYETYAFKPLLPSEQLLANFNGEKREFAQKLLACSRKKKIWFEIDIPSAMEKLGCDRTRAVRALDYFDEKGWIELKVTGLVHGYRKKDPFPGVDEIAEEYASLLAHREQNEVARIEQVFELASASECQAVALSRHFGQTIEDDCGHCTFCSGDGNLDWQPPKSKPLDPSLLEQIESLTQKHPEALQSKRSLARLLCGISSPALVRAKLTRDSNFGVCDQTPFEQVLKQLENFGS